MHSRCSLIQCRRCAAWGLIAVWCVSVCEGMCAEWEVCLFLFLNPEAVLSGFMFKPSMSLSVKVKCVDQFVL